MNEAYKMAGVDVEAGYQAVKLMKEHVQKTFIPGVMTDIGGFGGLFELPEGYRKPVLVSGTDGVGTKLRLAFLMDKHDTVGQDCVAMCVNDIVCCGAKPLFFLDYIATGRNHPEKIASIVKGVADGCVLSDCALIGGETAEMPGFYDDDEYDMAGFAVGVVEKDAIIDGKNVTAGNKLIGLASSGVHSNGFSLVRKLFNLNNAGAVDRLKEYSGALKTSVGAALLEPTRIYVKTITELTKKFKINAISHITGGGFYENIPRMLPGGTKAVIQKGSWEILPVFDIIQTLGNVSEENMFNTFNMGIGMILAVDAEIAQDVVAAAQACGESASVIGEITAGEKGVELC